MPLNTDAIQLMLQAWDQGVQGARARQIQAEATEQRKIENQQREADFLEKQKQNNLSHQLLTKGFELQKIAQEAQLSEQQRQGKLQAAKLYSEGVLGSSNDDFPDLTQMGINPDIIPGTGVINPGFQSPGMDFLGGALEQMGDVGSQLAKSIAGSQIVKPGTKQVAGYSFEPGELIAPRESVSYELAKDKLNREYAAINRQLNADLARAKTAEDRLAAEQKWRDAHDKILLEIAKNRNATAVVVQQERNKGRLSNNSNKEVKDILKERDKWVAYKQKIGAENLQTAIELAEQAIKNPASLDSAQQFDLVYAFIKAADPKTGVKDAEFKAVRELMATFIDRWKLNADNFTSGDMHLIPANVVAKIAGVMQRKQGVIKKEILDQRASYVRGAKKLGMENDEDEKVFFGSPFSDSTPTEGALPQGIFKVEEVK